MPNLKNAKKALRQSAKKQDKNFKVKENIKWLIKKTDKAITAKSDDAKELVAKVIKAVDKAIKIDVLKENTGNRKKSRLMKRLNTAFGVSKK